MRQEQLISKLIDLEDKANAHASEYHKLLGVPGNKAQASQHYRKALRLRAKVQAPHQADRPFGRRVHRRGFWRKDELDRLSDFGP